MTFPLAPELATRIEAAAPDVRVRVLGFPSDVPTDRVRYPSELQALVALDEIERALLEAEVLFAAWSGPLRELTDVRERAPRLRWVQLTHAGAENVPAALIEAGVTFTTGAGISSKPIAEWVLACMLMFAKGWPELFRDQQARRYRRFMPREFEGMTVGIVGMGTIGSEVARLAKAFGCRVVGMRRSCTERRADAPADECVPPADLDYLLAQSDFVVLAAALTEETRGLLAAREFGVMRPSAYLLNVARGALVDEAALFEALRAGTIAGAALDVFAREPLPADSPLWDLDNVILTPHIAGGTDRYHERATELFCANLQRYIAGEPLANVLDARRGY